MAPPAPIEPPPANLASACAEPAPLAGDASARELAGWTLEWIAAWRCERDKRAGLLGAWPR